MERSHDQFRDAKAEDEVPGFQGGEPKPEVTDTAEPNGPHTDRNEREGTEQEPSATEEALARTPQPQGSKGEDHPEPSGTSAIVETTPLPEGPQIEGSESELAQLQSELQQHRLAMTVCNISITQILAKVHSNFPPEVFKRFVKESGLKPHMVTKARPVGNNPWFNRPEVRQVFKGAEMTELYNAHCLSEGKKEELLARCQAGEPISRKLIDEVGGKAPKSGDSVIVFSVPVKRECVSQWSTEERVRFFKLIADFKLRCDTEAPYGVSSIENLGKLRPKT